MKDSEKHIVVIIFKEMSDGIGIDLFKHVLIAHVYNRLNFKNI